MADDDPERPSDDQEDEREKLAWTLARAGVAVPTDAGINSLSLFPPGKRTLHPAGLRGVAPGTRHWFATGPNNLGGRVRALAIDPTRDNVLYAGTASGGVFKTDDRGEHWRPLWQDQPSLSIAAIAVAPSAPDTIYVATGEHVSHVPGAGVFRSDDGGAHWTRIASAEALRRSFSLEAIAVHPTDPRHVWVVGERGAFRSLDATDPIPQFVEFEGSAGRPVQYYSDAVFGRAVPAAANPFVLYLCRGRTERGEIVRLDAPAAPDADIQARLAPGSTSTKQVFATAGVDDAERKTMRGKITVCDKAADAGVMYAAFAELTRSHENREDEFGLRQVELSATRTAPVIMRCTNANTQGVDQFRGTTWTPVPYRSTALPDDFENEDQGYYDLAIAVSPKNKDHVLFGMTSLYVCLNGTAASPAWHLAIPAELFRTERAAHADQHAIVFEHGSDPPPVWVGSDGGIVRCDNYAIVAPNFIRDTVVDDGSGGRDFLRLTRAMVPVNGIRWRQRIHGLVAAQAYDLTQSPLVPTMFGCGHQDNGVWYTTGGDTWRRVMRADGSFVAWDPVDPYHFLACWQGGISTMDFPGAWETTVPPPDLFLTPFLWPRMLSKGFHRLDGPRFAGDTIHHPRKATRVVTARRRRVYASDDGETFAPLPIGDVLELVATHQFTQPAIPDATFPRHDGLILLELVGGTAAAKFGLFRSVAFSSKNLTKNPHKVNPAPNPTRASEPFGTNVTSLRGLHRGPFALAAGDTLALRVRFRTRAPTSEQELTLPVVTFQPGHFLDIANASADEVARVITSALGQVFNTGTRIVTVEARPVLHGAASSVELMTSRLGAAATLTIGGTPAVLSALGVVAGTYHGSDGRPAAVSLQTLRMDRPTYPAEDLDVSVPDGSTLEIGIDGGPTRTVTFTSPPFANLAAIRAPELAKAIRAALDAAPAQPGRAAATGCSKSIAIFRQDTSVTPDAPVVAASTALARMTEGNIPPGRAHLDPPGGQEHELRFNPGTLFNAYDLSPTGAARVLRLTAAGAMPGNIDITLDAAGIVDLHRATVEELAPKIRAALPAGAKLRCEIRSTVDHGNPTELAYDRSEPAHLWVGTADGHLWASSDDGVTWRAIEWPDMVALGRPIEAIAISPHAPGTVYVGLGGRGNGANDPGTLWRTTDDGVSWAPIGNGRTVPAGNIVEHALAAAPGVAPAPASPRIPVSINEIVLDPDSASRLWVATEIGVFESADGGATFHAFSEGLPHADVIDLAYVPGRRMLRCAVWGRGTFARDVDASAPPDVSLFIRTSILDDGAVRPAGDGLDGFATSPRQPYRWESPDIKISRIAFADLGAVGSPDHLDAAEYDEVIATEPVGQHAGANDAYTIFVQIHNRSENAPARTDVFAYFVDCSRGVPDLPAAVWPPGSPIPPPWVLIGTASISDGPAASRPRVVRIPFTPPDDIAIRADQIAILALLTSPQDALTTGPLSVRELVEGERRAALRVVPTRTPRETEQLILRSLDGVPFTAVEAAPGALGLTALVATTDLRGNAISGTLDFTAGPLRRVTVTTVPSAPATPVTVEVAFAPAELRLLGADPAALTVPDLRRFINDKLRLGPIGVRCVAEAARIVVAADDHVADAIASSSAIADPATALRSGAWVTSSGLRAGATGHVYARIRNLGGAIEPSIAWRAYWFSTEDAPIRLDAAHQLATGTVVNVAPGGESILDVTFPAAAAVAGHRGVLIVSSSDGHPLRSPLAEPASGSETFADVVALDAYCAAVSNVAYRIFEVTP